MHKNFQTFEKFPHGIPAGFISHCASSAQNNQVNMTHCWKTIHIIKIYVDSTCHRFDKVTCIILQCSHSNDNIFFYFPLRSCFGLTINMAQGQMLQFVGLYLRTPVFSHSMLYVALSNLRHVPFFPWSLHSYIYIYIPLSLL